MNTLKPRAILFGGTNLLILCAKYLLDTKWDIDCIISDDHNVINWANDNNILTLHSTETEQINSTGFYLFSIINYKIISSEFLNSHQIPLAVNYHDSLLPKYAGINSTTWSILNQEKQHGISWHKIINGIDEGNILVQKSITIDPGESAYSLNLKCMEYAYTGFIELIDLIKQNKTNGTIQNLSIKSYFGKSHLPDNYAIINLSTTKAYIELLHYALDLGPNHVNPIATVKFYTNNTPYILDNHNKVLDIYGNLTPIEFDINTIQDIKLEDNTLKQLSRMKAQESKNYDFLIKELSNLETNTGIININQNNSADIFSNTLSHDLSSHEVITHLALILTHFAQNDSFIKLYHSKSMEENSVQLTDIVSIIPLKNEDLDLNYTDYHNKIISKINHKIQISKDFAYRYWLNLDSDVAITFDDQQISNKHKIIINIQHNKINIKCDLQNKIIAESILTQLKTCIENPCLNKQFTLDIAPSYMTNNIIKQNNLTVSDTFKSIVEQYPNHIALVYEEQTLTYMELNNKVNQIANYLHANFKPHENEVIAICFDKNIEMIVAILGIIKANCAYVPLDIKYPNERLNYILQNTKARILLTQDELLNTITQKITDFIHLISLSNNHNINESPTFDNNYNNKPNNLAYVIYTSGTTGNPKGVMVHNEALIRFALDKSYVTATHEDRFLAYADYVFDCSIFDIFVSLLNGATLHLYPKSAILDVELLSQFIDKYKINYAFSTTSLFQSYVPYPNNPFLKIKTIVIGGEKVNNQQIKTFLSNYNGRLINGYGPTEGVVFATCAELTLENVDISPIGISLEAKTTYVFNRRMQLVPKGIIGELYIGGLGIALGYYNQPELTADKFIKNPLNNDEIIYKSGDLVRILDNNNLEYIGRSDQQIKIRGYRVELSEIENALNKYPDIKQSAVITIKANDGFTHKHIIAYYTATKTINEGLIYSFLNQHLPEYMLPDTIIYIEHMPYTINGKLDKKALPTPILRHNSQYIEPRSETEQKICEIFSKLLNLPQVGIEDEFFSIGGNSILAIQLVNILNNTFNCNLSIKNIIELKTPDKLVSLVENTRGEFKYQNYQITESFLNQTNLYDEFELNNVQQAYYFGRFNMMELGNISTHMYTEFKFMHLDHMQLEKAINIMIKHHIGLTTIINDGKQTYLEHIPQYRIPLHIHNNYNGLLQLRNELSHKIYDVSQPFMFDIQLSKLDNHYILHFGIDAILFDGRSIDIFFNDLTTIYHNNNLAPLQVCYKDYIHAHNKIRNSKLFFDAKEYWDSKITQYNFTMNLPLKNLPSTIKHPRFARQTTTIAYEIWNKIKTKAINHGIMPTAILLMAYSEVLSYWTNQEKLCINMTLSNRLPIHPQINNVIGDFTVLELFNYDALAFSKQNLLTQLKQINNTLVSDIENSLFDGIDVMRLAREKLSIEKNKALTPVVLTSILGEEHLNKTFIDSSYLGVEYAITQTSQVWLDNKAFITQDGLVAEWDYVEQLFDNNIIKNMHTQYCNLLTQIANLDWENNELPDIVTPENDLLLINHANSAILDIQNTTLFNNIESFIKTNNLYDKTAIIDSKNHYSYLNLIQDSDNLAKYLHQLNTNSSLIGILSEKNYNQIVSAIAIMKSNHGYLPLNSSWPTGRLVEILQEGNVKTLLISKALNNNLALHVELSHYFTLIEIESTLDNLKNINPNIILPNVSPLDIAYVIFTSGSSGKPKGVTISHQGALNTIQSVNHKFNLSQNDNILALSELSFDLSVYDLFGILAVGGTIIFPNPLLTKEPEHWLELITKYNISIWNTVPQLASLLIENINEENKNLINSLRLFLLSGDWIPLTLPNNIKKYIPEAQTISLGGATEGSIWSIWYEIQNTEPSWTSIPYGYAMPNQKMYVLNKNLNHCPINVIGEIYIGGDGVALNYWQDQQRTNTSFINHHQFGRIYKTGDLGAWSINGYIDFKGRIDNQVKLNGYRVELEEIAAKLNHLSGVQNAITIIQESSIRNYLVAYLVPTSEFSSWAKDADNKKSLTKMKQLGIIKNTDTTYKVEIQLKDSDYYLRKSYRNIIPLDTKDITKLNLQLEHNIQYLNNILGANNLYEINIKHLTHILKFLSAKNLENHVLPKYFYPSAGSSYPIRSFINIANNLDKYSNGYYYYHPLELSLNEQQCPYIYRTNQNYIDFVIHWPAIYPLYEDEAEHFAYIEIGHILGLILNYMYNNKLKYSVEILNQEIDHDNTLAVRLYFSNNLINKFTHDIQPIIFNKNTNNIYTNSTHNKTINLNDKSIFIKANNFSGRLLELSNEVVAIDKITNMLDESLLSGIFLQLLSDSLYSHNIGSCMLGYRLYDGVSYSMVLTKIDEQEKTKSKSDIIYKPLSHYINNEIKDQLPEYMLPYDYIIINNLPLSPNGKLDKNKLPQLDLSIQKTNYVAPRNQIEQTICELMAKTLNINEFNAIGIENDFFKLGGNSLLAIKLVTYINNYFKSHLTVTEIFTEKTPKNLVSKVLYSKNHYQTIIKLNNTYDKPNLFMIHPGLGGCEVYSNLANQLEGQYSCYGIDSYNLHHTEKITNLHSLAQYYLKYIKEIMLSTKQTKYTLLGWSLGGQLSIEIAGILENSGIHDIRAFILDTILIDPEIRRLVASQNANAIKEALYNHYLPYGKKYVEKVLNNYNVEELLSDQENTYPLKTTQVVLFKAMQADPMSDGDEPDVLFPYTVKLKYNNIDQICKSTSQITVVNLNDASHANVLQQEKKLLENLLE